VTDRFDLDLLTAEPADVYHARRGEFLSSHALADFRRCPRLFRDKECGGVPDRDGGSQLRLAGGRGAGHQNRAWPRGEHRLDLIQHLVPLRT